MLKFRLKYPTFAPTCFGPPRPFSGSLYWVWLRLHNTAQLIKMYFCWLFLQKCNFSQAQYKLTEDGPGGPKHVGANVGYFNVNFNILYV